MTGFAVKKSPRHSETLIHKPGSSLHSEEALAPFEDSLFSTHRSRARKAGKQGK